MQRMKIIAGRLEEAQAFIMQIFLSQQKRANSAALSLLVLVSSFVGRKRSLNSLKE
jgi:hypothetical protein